MEDRQGGDRVSGDAHGGRKASANLKCHAAQGVHHVLASTDCDWLELLSILVFLLPRRPTGKTMTHFLFIRREYRMRDKNASRFDRNS